MRYDFLSLLKQQAIEDPRNEVPASFVKLWLRDVRQGVSWEDVIELLLRHYSMAGDTVRFFNRAAPTEFADRTVISMPARVCPPYVVSVPWFHPIQTFPRSSSMSSANSPSKTDWTLCIFDQSFFS
jgi:hypothetical protein